jgi:2-amino-4-hydroxy-6-hydroxymethyldihydropteridine diphosphokinase
MHQVFLGIGGNTGNKQDNFDKVYTFIENELGEIRKLSSVYESPPWGFQSEEKFWNQVVFIVTELSPEELIKKIAEIENRFGRERGTAGYISRKMDIDILYFDELILNSCKTYYSSSANRQPFVCAGTAGRNCTGICSSATQNNKCATA